MSLSEEVQHLYSEPGIGATYINTYGELNIKNLVEKYRSLNESEMQEMLAIVIDFSKSFDLSASYLSVGVLHALGQDSAVEEAYQWEQKQDNPLNFTHHYDIGKSLADYYTKTP